MATIKELRLRIKSLKNTGKITSAMKMVSASKMKKAQDAISSARPYSKKMEEIVQRVSNATEKLNHPLLEEREIKTVRYYIFTSDKGLCGSFNNGIFRFFVKNIQNEYPKANVELVPLSTKAKGFFKKIIRDQEAEGNGKSNLSIPEWALDTKVEPVYENSDGIAKQAMDDFLSGKIDKAVLVYNQFISVLTQKPLTETLLPVSKEASIEEDADTSADAALAGATSNSGSAANDVNSDYIFEPNLQDLFADLVPQMVAIKTYSTLLENAAGEHGARMSAMDTATNNVKELIGKLTLQMNRARQAAITTELTEIVSGAEAL